MNIESTVERIAKKHEALSNPIRIHLLSIVIALEEASWSKIKAVFERVHGGINPNTLAFHIKKLLKCNLLLKYGSVESPIYKANVPKELKREIEEVVKFYRQFVGGSDEC
jgi:DNA-binding transcriptional ArsR family regulator